MFFVFKLDMLCLWKLILQVYLSKLILHNVHDVHEFSKTEKFGLFLCTHEGEQIKEPNTILQFDLNCKWSFKGKCYTNRMMFKVFTISLVLSLLFLWRNKIPWLEVMPSKILVFLLCLKDPWLCSWNWATDWYIRWKL